MIDASGTAFQKKYHVYVVNDPEPYAAASPDGYLFIHTGMFKLKLSDAETAALIGHELGHVILKHWLARLQRELPPDLLEKYAEKTYPVDSPRIARLYRAVRHTGYTPDEEYEADMAGAQFLADDAYPPKSMPGLLKKLYKNRRGKKGKDPYLAVHPLTPARIKQIEAQVPLVKPRTKRLF